MNIDTGNDREKVFRTFSDIGCCKICCLRFIGEKCPKSFMCVEQTLKTLKICLDEELSPQPKIAKDNACIACLGLLQKPYCDVLLHSVLKSLQESDYDCETYNLALNLPVSLQLRSHSLFLHLQAKFPSFCFLHFQLGVVTIGVKDVWKWIYTSLISDALQKKYDSNSDLTITVSLKYVDEEKECSSLILMCPDKFSKSKNRKNQGSHDNFSRKSAELFLKTVDSQTFSNQYAVPPTVPSSEISYCETTTLHNSIYIAGRYNKLSRTLPQTPWILNGKRKAEGSVEELISEQIKLIIKSSDSRFGASGREDVDVRALGRGRPFYVELINPHRIKLDFEVFRKLEADINLQADGQIYVRDLQAVSKKSLDILKEGEEKKSKQYRALCVLLEPSAREGFDAKLNQLPSLFPITLKQSTPIRVLHRRPVAVRDKTVFWLKTTPLQKERDLFTISLNTQAGTYIKEFVHGDFGRTTPSLGDLLGGLEVDIIALDVLDVVLDWPPSVTYTS